MYIPVSIFDRLNTQHLSLPTIIEGLGNEQIINHPIPDKWSIRDNIAHLARYQVVFLERLHKILSDTEPVFEAYRAENDPEFAEWLGKGPNELMLDIRKDRRTIIDELTTLTQAELQRVGVHSKFGNLTVLDWTEFFVLHEAHHLFTIFRLVHMQLITEK
jgi:DinB superfamily